MGIYWGEKKKSPWLKVDNVKDIDEFSIVDEFRSGRSKYSPNLAGCLLRTDGESFMYTIKDEFDLPKLQKAYGKDPKKWINKSIFLKRCVGKNGPYLMLGVPDVIEQQV